MNETKVIEIDGWRAVYHDKLKDGVRIEIYQFDGQQWHLRTNCTWDTEDKTIATFQDSDVPEIVFERLEAKMGASS